MQGIFLDLETNGLNFAMHRVLEIAFKVVDLKTDEEVFSFSKTVRQPDHVWEKSNPDSLRINGLTQEKNQLGCTEEEVRNEICQDFFRLGLVRGEAVFICQNPSFDRLFFSQLVPVEKQEELLFPYHWLDLASMFWSTVGAEQKWKLEPSENHTPLSKDYIAEYFGLPKEPEPHKAINGVNHLLACYRSVVNKSLAS